MLSWPNSPLLVLLQIVGPNVLTGYEDEPLEEDVGRLTPLHVLTDLVGPSDYSTHENQLILAKQLIEGGANVNAVSIPHGKTPLHSACSGNNVTNLDFVELLLDRGANPNSQNHVGLTPVMCTITDAPGAAKFLLNWPTTDVNIIPQCGVSFLDVAMKVIKDFSDDIARSDNPDRVRRQFLFQWRGIKEMLVEKGAHTGLTAIG
jgi:hypothetical protein